ncbi:methyltransferase [Roseovarius sp. HI0049]|nr:methyltransferase [Roseovarius sp. HI0049]
MPRRDLPAELASVAETGGDARMSAPSAERNAGPIRDLLRAHAPAEGRALEIASGTGQHVLAFARAFPGLTWQPTEIAAERRASIDAWAATEGLANLRPAVALDATVPGWADDHGGQDLIVLVNLLHLISTPEAKAIISETARALAPGGRFVLYGPFLRDGEATSEGDARFDASLRASDPEVGYKDDFTTIDWLHAAGLSLVEVVEMPANNLAFVTQRPEET